MIKESQNNKIGVVFDKSISKKVLNVHINTINAVKTIYDIDVLGYEITEENVGVEFFIDKTGSSMGNVKNLTTIKNSALKLIEKYNYGVSIDTKSDLILRDLDILKEINIGKCFP